jgi:hypothetical protein
VSNARFDAELVSFDERYENDQTRSPAFDRHVDEMVDRVLRASVMHPIDLVEVACGQGYFMERLWRRAGPALRMALGFDPAYRGAEMPGGIRIKAGIFDGHAASRLPRPPNALVARHLIGYLPDPVEFLKGLRSQMVEGPSSRMFLETPCVEWILRHNTVQDFFYEHCSYFSADSLALALHRAGFKAHKIDHVFGGQYLWAEAIPQVRADAPDGLGEGPMLLRALAQDFTAAQDEWRQRWKRQLALARNRGPVAVWGAGAKGVTFVNLLDPETSLIRCLVDINPRKQGMFVPLTGHLIVSWQRAMEAGVRTVVVMNPNYLTEVEEQVRSSGTTVMILEA